MPTVSEWQQKTLRLSHQEAFTFLRRTGLYIKFCSNPCTDLKCCAWIPALQSASKAKEHDSQPIAQQSHSLLFPSVSFPLPWLHLVLQAPKTLHQERESFSNLLATVGCASNTNQCASVYWTGVSCSRHEQDQTLVSFRSAARLQAVLPTAKVQPSPQARIGSLHLTLSNLDKCSLSCILI